MLSERKTKYSQKGLRLRVLSDISELGFYCIMIKLDCQGEFLEVFHDFSSSGREKPWAKKKLENQDAEVCYRLLASRHPVETADWEYWSRRADRLRDCGVQLFFQRYLLENGQTIHKPKHLNSCRVRLCPMCAWRRSTKIQAHTRKILEAMQTDGKYAYLLLTLTVPNVRGEDLSSKLDEMMKGWKKLEQGTTFKRVVKGWYRGLEVTHNLSRDDYHPHFHCLLAVDGSHYFGRNYIKQEDWLTMWRKATRDDRITQVDIRRIRPKAGGTDGDAIIAAVCEVAKYTVKTADYIDPRDWRLSAQTVEILDGALGRRRLVAYGGVMKDWHKRLNLDDEIDGDLAEDDTEGEPTGEVCVLWHAGYQQYVVWS